MTDGWFDNENLTSAQARLLYNTESNELYKIIDELYTVINSMKNELPEEKLNELYGHIERVKMRKELLDTAYALKRMEYESQITDTEN